MILRRLAVVIALGLLAGCADDPPPAPETSAAGVSMHLDIEESRVVAGTVIEGTLRITNDTGAAIDLGCEDAWVAVGLENDDVDFDPSFDAKACAPGLQLATGVTEFPVQIQTAGADGPLPGGIYLTKVVLNVDHEDWAPIAARRVIVKDAPTI